MGGTVVGQRSGVPAGKFYCEYCQNWKEFCFAQFDYCPAGTDSLLFSFCESCLEYMLKTVKEKKAEAKKRARAETRKRARKKAKRAKKVRLKR